MTFERLFAKRRRRLPSAAPLVVCLIGCERAAHDGSLASPTPSVARAVEPIGSAAAPPTKANAPAPQPILPDGCHTGVKTKHAADLVEALAEACSPNSSVLLRGPGDAEADAEPSFELDAPTCVRVIAATAASSRVSATLKGPSGGAIAEATSGARFALLDPNGPICITQPGRYTLGLSSDTKAAIHYAVLGPRRH